MLATDIRLGNTIESKRNSCDWYPVTVTFHDMKALRDPSFSEVYRGIPLTVSHLRDFGFDDINGVCFQKGNWYVADHDGVWWIEDRHDNKVVCEVDYVHDLQNAWYLLNWKEELEVMA